MSYLTLGLSLALAIAFFIVGIARNQPAAFVDTATAQQQRCCAPKSPQTECRPC